MPFARDRKIRLVCSSWSDNPRKGGPAYRWLEPQLDWERYEFTFVGNTATPFERIRHVRRCRRPSSRELLREHDVFVDGDRATTPTRTRSSRRSPAACRRSTSRAAAAREAVKDAGFALHGAGGDPGAARPARRRVRGAAGGDRPPDAGRDRRRLPRGARARRVRRAVAPRRPPGRAAARADATRALGRRARGSSSSARAPAGSIDHDLRALAAIARRLGVRVADRRLLHGLARPGRLLRRASSRCSREPWRPAAARARRRVLPRPARDAGACPSSTRCYAALSAHHAELDARPGRRTPRCEELVLATGIDPAKVLRIPIGIDLARFAPQTPERRAAARAALGLPRDGVRRRLVPEGRRRLGRRARAEADQGAGRAPRRARARCSARVPGAARPALRAGARLRPSRASSGSGSRTVHRRLDRYEDDRARSTPRSTPTSSRRGRRAGRRACSRRWRAGVPLVTTRVGQATELVRHGENGWMVEVEDAEGLARCARPRRRRPARARRCSAGLETAPRQRLRRAAARSGARSSTASWSVREPLPWARAERRVRERATRSPTCASPRRELPRLARDRAHAAAPRRDRRLVRRRRACPAADDVVIGGAREVPAPARALPNAPRDFNVLYLGSSSMPRDGAVLARLARRRGAAFVWNQNGVAYPGWYGEGYELVNRPRARAPPPRRPRLLPDRVLQARRRPLLRRARGALGGAPEPGRHHALHAGRRGRERPLTLLLGGSQYQRYRLEAALEALALAAPGAAATRACSSRARSRSPPTARRRRARSPSGSASTDAVDLARPLHAGARRPR